MHRKLLAIFSIAFFLGISTSNVKAAELDDLSRIESVNPVLVAQNTTPQKIEAPAASVTVEHTIVKNESLSKVAKIHNTTWLRLWAKNLQLTNPDLIFEGATLTIPAAGEQLADRPLPSAAPTPAELPRTIPTAPPAHTKQPAASTTRAIGRAAIRGNGYTPGQCTWHVKNLKADLPNNLGNANQWYGRAKAQGLPVGTAPKAGAAAMRKSGNHVVYVLAVNGGQITISEMNYNWTPYAKRTRVANASDFLYIY